MPKRARERSRRSRGGRRERDRGDHGEDAVSAVATRQAFGEAIVRVGERDDRVVVLTGDLRNSTNTEAFAKTFPQRFFEIGIAEANMVGVAAGLTLCGKVPFACSFAAF